MSRFRTERPDLRALSASLRYLPQEVTDLRRSEIRSARPRRTCIRIQLVRREPPIELERLQGYPEVFDLAPADLPEPRAAEQALFQTPNGVVSIDLPAAVRRSVR